MFCSGVHCVHPTLVQPRLPRSCSLHPTARTWLRSSAGVGACPSSQAAERITESRECRAVEVRGLHGIGFQVTECRKPQPCPEGRNPFPEGMCQGYRDSNMKAVRSQDQPGRKLAKDLRKSIEDFFLNRSSSGQDFFKWVTSMYLQSSRDHK